MRRNLCTFIAGLVTGIWLVLWQGDTIGTRLNHAGAVLVNAAQPTYVDTAFADFAQPAVALGAPYVVEPRTARQLRERPSREPARRARR